MSDPIRVTQAGEYVRLDEGNVQVTQAGEYVRTEGDHNVFVTQAGEYVRLDEGNVQVTQAGEYVRLLVPSDPVIPRPTAEYNLYVHKPRVVFRAQIDQTNFAYPINQVLVKNMTAGYPDFTHPGMTVVFGTQPGWSDRGRQRITRQGLGNTIYFARSGQGRNPTGGADGGRDGEVDLEADLYVEVWDDRRVWPKIPVMLPEGDGVRIYKDGEVFMGSQMNRPHPVAVAGPARAGTAKGDPLGLEFSFDGSASFAVHTGATITGYSWNPGDGAVTGGSLTGPTVSLNFAPGFRYVSLTVTDSENNTHTTHVPVVVEDPYASITVEAFEIVSHRLDIHGAELTVRVLSELDALEYPDGTLVILWEGEPAGPSDHSHLRFVGWHNHDPGDMQATETGMQTDVVLECVDVAGRLKLLPGFAQEVENVGTDEAIRWYQMANANMDKYLVYLLHWHSTALEVAPFTWSGTGPAYNFMILSSNEGSLFEQVQQAVQNMIPPRHFTCNSRGELRVLPDPMLQEVSDRTTTVQRLIAAETWASIRALHRRPPRVGKLHGGAVIATHTPLVVNGREYPPTVFCVAPGETIWGHGQAQVRQENYLAPNQHMLNMSIGHLYARHNALEDHFNITLADGDWPQIEPADLTWIQLEVPEEITTPRLRAGVARLLPHAVEFAYQHTPTGTTCTVTVTAEMETRGIPAQTVFPNPELQVVWWTDFSDLATDAIIHHTPNWWEAFVSNDVPGVDWVIIEDPEATGGKLAHFDQEDTDKGVGLTWLVPGHLEDVEVLGRCRVTTHQRIVGILLRATETGCYRLNIRSGVTGSGIFRLDGTVGEPTALHQGGANPDATWHWLRFRAVGDVLKGKLWIDGESEPTTGGPDGDGFQFKATDSTYQSGRVGFAGATGSAVGDVAHRQVDVLSVTIPPNSAPFTPPF